MFSTLTVRGGEATPDALSAGATDYVAKPSGVGTLDRALDSRRAEVIPKLRQWGKRSQQLREKTSGGKRVSGRCSHDDAGNRNLSEALSSPELCARFSESTMQEVCLNTQAETIRSMDGYIATHITMKRLHHQYQQVSVESAEMTLCHNLLSQKQFFTEDHEGYEEFN
jgi:chemotaxis response regulator CheB